MSKSSFNTLNIVVDIIHIPNCVYDMLTNRQQEEWVGKMWLWGAQ